MAPGEKTLTVSSQGDYQLCLDAEHRIQDSQNSMHSDLVQVTGKSFLIIPSQKAIYLSAYTVPVPI